MFTEPCGGDRPLWLPWLSLWRQSSPLWGHGGSRRRQGPGLRPTDRTRAKAFLTLKPLCLALNQVTQLCLGRM